MEMLSGSRLACFIKGRPRVGLTLSWSFPHFIFLLCIMWDNILCDGLARCRIYCDCGCVCRYSESHDSKNEVLRLVVWCAKLYGVLVWSGVECSRRPVCCSMFRVLGIWFLCTSLQWGVFWIPTLLVANEENIETARRISIQVWKQN